MNDREKLHAFLAEQHIMVLAVTLDDGTPWAVPVAIKHWEGNVFEWDSKLDTIHSEAIKARPDMAMTTYQKHPDAQIGFYAKGRGEMIQEKDHGLARYRFTAERCWINDETFTKREISL